MKKLKYIIPLIIFILGSKVYAVTPTNVPMSNSTFAYSPVKNMGTYYYYDTYISNVSINTAQSTTSSTRWAGRSRTYAYFTSANALRRSNQYTAKMRVCGGSSVFGSYVSEAVPAKIHWAYNTTTSMTGAINGNINDLIMTYQVVSPQNGCIDFTFLFTPPVDGLRAVGFWVSYSRLSPVSTCWEADCSSEHRQDDVLVDTAESGSSSGIFKVSSLTISYIEGGTDTATIERNQQLQLEQQQQINDKLTNLPTRIWNIFKEGLKELFIPSEEQMQDLFDTMEEEVTSRMGILGLPISIYNNLMSLVTDIDSERNWCINWNDVSVPNFENYNIIEHGTWCFDTLEQKESLRTLRSTSHGIMGALILLSFLAYLNNCKNRILEIPDRDDYIYFTEEDVFIYDRNTGETTDFAQHRSRKTRREKVKK